MKAFRYRLERLLHLASAHRQERARALAEARDVLRQWEERWNREAAERRAAQDRWRHRAAGATRLTDWLDYQCEAELRRAAEQRAARAVAEQQDHVAERRGDYLEARRDERLLASLRARAYSRWALEVGREEQRGLDEAAAAARARRGNETGGPVPPPRGAGAPAGGERG